MSRRNLLSWVLVACLPTDEQRAAIENTLRRTGGGHDYQRGQTRTDAPTMVFQKAVGTYEELPEPTKDGHARIVLDPGYTYISIVGIGWVQLKAID